jgi:hypothetical protein
MLPGLSSISLRTRSGVRLILVVIITAVIVAACGSSASTAFREGGPANAPGPVTAATAAPSAVAAPGVPVQDGSGQAGPGSNGNDAPGDNGPLVVKTGSVSLEVKDIDEAVLLARGRIVGLGGYVSDSERANRGDDASALITYRIPASRWDEALDGLRGLAQKVTSEQTKAAEVTGQVVDLDARIANLRSTERALQAIMAQATRITDVLEVQNQLTSVQGQIEQLTAQRSHLADQAAMGTLAVTYSVPVVAVTEATSDWNLAVEFDRAVAQLLQIGRGLAVVGVWIGVVALPVLFGVLLVVGLVYMLVRRFGPRSSASTGSRPGAGPGVATPMT